MQLSVIGSGWAVSGDWEVGGILFVIEKWVG